MNKYLEEAEKYARHYDHGASEQQYYGPEILFGLMYSFLKKNDRFLDIGIGTGLDAVLFNKAGARVYGIDGAAEMLKICEEKGVASELKKLDLLKDPIPYPDNYFDLALANALFHMIEDPTLVFREASRTLKENGVFGFTIDETVPGKSPYKKTGKAGISSCLHPESRLKMYRHSDDFIKTACQNCGLEILKKTEFLAFCGKEGLDDFYFTAYITGKNKHLHFENDKKKD